MKELSQFSQFGRFAPEFDAVYAAIASAIRSTRPDPSAPRQLGRMTKSRVAAIHRKMRDGEALEAGQEQDIADRLRRQLGAAECRSAGTQARGEQ